MFENCPPDGQLKLWLPRWFSIFFLFFPLHWESWCFQHAFLYEFHQDLLNANFLRFSNCSNASYIFIVEKKNWQFWKTPVFFNITSQTSKHEMFAMGKERTQHLNATQHIHWDNFDDNLYISVDSKLYIYLKVWERIEETMYPHHMSLKSPAHSYLPIHSGWHEKAVIMM